MKFHIVGPSNLTEITINITKLWPIEWYMMPKKSCIDYIDIIVYNTNYMVIKGDKELTSNNAVSEICPSATTIALN